jgi:NAD(P)-dependent dehydrogenase (short-subunit alcohol dehydrogenase family)
MSNRLEGKTAVVTGGSAGIGKATCLRFAEEGANVVPIGRHMETLEETVAEIEAEGWPRAHPVEADIGEPDDIERMADEVDREFGTVDVLVNNAAARPKELGPVTEHTAEGWDHILGVNVRGTALCAKHVVPLMDDGGAIVNVSTAAAVVARKDWTQYDTTKGGIDAMTRDMAIDLAEDDIRVNTVSPGWVITEHHIGDRTGAEAERFIEEKTNPHEGGPGIQRRAAKPEEVAPAILFVASEEASFITGETFYVDGGNHITGTT